ncbi:anthrone oxygenase family protein [Kineococcus endophyticus]|uniref:Anthrone oxygenase family protein n=1 Tax=Kineococcus endophyticus TaxID=1181883 RepID=A0ABV3PCN6_9ACTN
MTSVGSLVEHAHLGTTAALVLLVAVDPTSRLRDGDGWETWLRGQQRVDRVMRRVAPPVYQAAGVLAVAATVVAARDHDRRAAVCRSAAALCVGASVAVTLRVNEPVNALVRQWRPFDDPAPGWAAARARWERSHRVRRVLAAAAGVAAVAARRA